MRLSARSKGVKLVLEMEDLGQSDELLVCPSLECGEQLGHRCLPAGGRGGGGQEALRGLEIVDLEVAGEQSVGPEEERVVATPGCGDRVEHVGPDRGVPLRI